MTSFGDVINSDTPVLVDFFAEWCGPCKMMAPTLKHAKEAVGDKVQSLKVDIDKIPEGAQHYGIQGVPALILFKDGTIKWRESGGVPAQTLQQVINQDN